MVQCLSNKTVARSDIVALSTPSKAPEELRTAGTGPAHGWAFLFEIVDCDDYRLQSHHTGLAPNIRHDSNFSDFGRSRPSLGLVAVQRPYQRA